MNLLEKIGSVDPLAKKHIEDTFMPEDIDAIKDLEDNIWYCVAWGREPQGYQYWKDIFNKLKLPNIPNG